MKRYRIANKRSRSKSVATLLYDENRHEFCVKIPQTQDVKKLPMLLRASVMKGCYEMTPQQSMAWVRGRIVPSERQNIGQFLREYGLNKYSEDLILEKTNGESIQDNFVVIREE